MSRILLVYADLRHGGIETLIIRLANHLAGRGRQVAICHCGGTIAGNINDDVEQLLWTTRKQAVRKAVGWIGHSSAAVTMISFDPISAALGLAIEISASGKAPVTHLSGVYHPRSFFMTGERRDRIWLNRLVARAVGDPFIFYMNEECRADHERQWKADLGDSRIIPLPIEERPAQWRGKGDPLRIVSVGRLVDFKTYNLAAAELTAECRRRGIDLRWDIYGTGPLAAEMRSAIDQHQVGGAVELKGELPYERFAETVAAHGLFIGMGTAALEAAMIGVPTIVATESERRRSYGFVSELPFGNVGERQPFPPPHDIADLIRNFASASAAERTEISQACRNAVLGYSYEHCLDELDRLAQASIHAPTKWYKRSVSLLYEGMTASRLAQLARRALAITRA